MAASCDGYVGGEAQYLGAAVQALGAVCLGTVASVSGRRVTRRTVRLLPALAVTLALSLSHRDVRAESGCGDFGSLGVVLASAGAFLVGSVGSATSAGVLAAGNEDKDFSFFKGFAYGELGVAIYSVSYLALDNALGCAIVNDADGYPWSVMLGGGVVGALVPLLVYAGSDSVPQASSNLALKLTF